MTQTKMFLLKEIAPLLDAYGFNGGMSDSEGHSFQTRLKFVELNDSCVDDDRARSLLTITFMDPQDDRFYQATCWYDKDESGPPDWENVNREGKHFVQFTPAWYMLPHEEQSFKETDTIRCVQVERRTISIEGWKEKE